MHWELLILPAIGLAVFLLSSLFSRKKDKPPAPNRDVRAAVPRPPQQRTPQIERFMQEVQSRRQAAVPAPPPPAKQEPIRRRPTVRAERPVGRPSDDIPFVLAVEQPSRPAPPTVVVVEALAVPVQPRPGTAMPVRNATPAVAQLLTLLRSPQNLATAVMLREVLDKPLAMRRRR